MADDFRCQVKQIIADFKAAERITGDISVGIVAVAVALWAVLLAGTMALQAELFYFATTKIGAGRDIVAATVLRRRNCSTFRRRKLESDATSWRQRPSAGGPFYSPARWRCSDSRFQAQTWQSLQLRGSFRVFPCSDSRFQAQTCESMRPKGQNSGKSCIDSRFQA